MVKLVCFMMCGVLSFCRLSKALSAKLRDGNPNIADLNDIYRPTKLAEMFSELYDNEWTDAYTALENEMDENDIVAYLLNIVMVSYWAFK